MARNPHSGYYERQVTRARLRSARNAGLPMGKPRGMCWQPGCTDWGIYCYFPDHEWGRPGGGPRKHPDDCLCDKHIERAGFCRGCGQFWAGVESFEFGRYAGWCDNCQVELRHEEEEEREWYAGDVDYDHDPYDRDWPGPIVIIGGFPEEVAQ